MRLWTIQGIEIYEQLQRDGVAYCTKPAQMRQGGRLNT